MKIDSTPTTRVAPAQDGVARSQQGASAAADSAAATSAGTAGASSSADTTEAHVSLSSLSSHLRSLAASGSADIDTAQVESIKSAIRNGTLQIDTGKIADGVIATARSLLKPSSTAA